MTGTIFTGPISTMGWIIDVLMLMLGFTMSYIMYSIKQAIRDLQKELHDTSASLNKLAGRVSYLEGRMPPRRRFDDLD